MHADGSYGDGAVAGAEVRAGLETLGIVAKRVDLELASEAARTTDPADGDEAFVGLGVGRTGARLAGQETKRS